MNRLFSREVYLCATGPLQFYSLWNVGDLAVNKSKTDVFKFSVKVAAASLHKLIPTHLNAVVIIW